MAYTTHENQIRRRIAGRTSIGASVLLIIVGVLSVLQGISAVADDELFIVDAEYVYEFTTSTWGWIHIVIGAALAICALGLLAETTWGRGAAMTVAALSILANFLSVPYEPAWSILIIALDVVVIWAISTWRGATE